MDQARIVRTGSGGYRRRAMHRGWIVPHNKIVHGMRMLGDELLLKRVVPQFFEQIFGLRLFHALDPLARAGHRVECLCPSNRMPSNQRMVHGCVLIPAFRWYRRVVAWACRH